ncbi:MAG: glycosyltransferase family 4 protein [Endomicrobia bacterium]|nr:glycosyltransferase family 4 protein [Endomicrobiia bacterium]MCL2799443.1 glycosyltransferase family 4 protein [Endomicrobiia bacterium]
MKYKILHIFSSWTIGGAEKATLFLADSLQKSGETQNFIAAPAGSFLFEQAVKKNLTVFPFKAKNSFGPFAILNLIRIIKKNNINIIHAHQGKLYWTALIARFFCPKIKVVFHRRQDTRHSFFSRSHYKFADAVIAVSKAVAGGLVKYEQVAPEKIKVVYNGVNLDKFSLDIDFSDIVKDYYLEWKTVVGTVGAIVDLKGKGQIFLIEASKILRTDFPNLCYLIVGAGNGLEDLKQYAKNIGVDDIVYFTGYQEQVQKYVSAMDIFCLLSWDTEGMPNVLIEAQALKKPVIATNVGGIPEAFLDNVTGIMIEPSNVAQTAKAIKELASDSDKAKHMGENGRKFVERKFTIKNMVSDVLDVYNKIMPVKK